MKKRIIALFLTVVMLVSALPLGALAAQPASEEALVDAGDVSIQGTNSFGTMLSQEITESQAETAEESEDFQAGYSVTDLVIEDATATVTYDTMEEALLVVALYTEDGMRMLTSATATVTADATEATVEFTGEMPEYFLASAYLVDTYDLSPLCAAYDTPMYTQEMQELLASTVEDYDADRVLNLDDDSTTNFAVYAESTKIIEAAEAYNTVASIDDENATYIIENADEQITSLAVGDVFVYEYADEALLIAKVAAITIDGTTVTITGGDVEMEEVFSLAKIDGSLGTDGAEVDDSTAGEGITYSGKTNSDSGQLYVGNEISVMGVDGELSRETAANFDYEFVEKGVFSLKGKLSVQTKVSFEYYITWSYQHVEFKVDFGGKVGIEAEISGSTKEINVPISTLRFPVVPGITIAFTPKFIVKASVTVSGSLEFTTTVGFGFEHSNHGSKFLNLCKSPEATADFEIEGKIFIGFTLTPAVKVLEGALADAKVSGELGFEIKGGIVDASTGDGPETKHECIGCLDGNVAFKLKVTPELTFLKSKKLKFSTELFNASWDLFDFYLCAQHLEGGLGHCPRIVHKVTVEVCDGNGNPVAGAEVSVNKTTVQTNQNGIAEIWLAAAHYTVVAADPAETLVESTGIYVDSPCKAKILLPINAGEEEDPPRFGILGTVDTEEVTDMSVVKEATFNDNRYQLLDSSMTWTEAQAYCESIGGHLVTIASAEEQAFIESLMESGGKKQYWIGMYYDNGLRWVTDELIRYTNWDYGEPNRNERNGRYENYIHIYNVPNPVVSRSQRFKWNDIFDDNMFPNEENFFHTQYVGLICEFESEELSYREVFNGHTYQLIDNGMTSWEDAAAYCETLGGHLATITSQEENDFLYQYMQSCGYGSAYWGFTDKNTEGVWEWCTGEAVTYTNWAEGQPDNEGSENFGMFWDGLPGGVWNDGNFSGSCAYFCEWDSASGAALLQNEITMSPNAVYPGDYSTEVTDTYVLKTASFTGLVPDEQYVLLAMKSIEAEAPLASDNLLFIDQGVALEDGTLSFQYVQRETAEISYVVACGASNKNLKDAEITFPEMTADGELQVVDPAVVYDGVTLTEGRDYVIVGTVDYTEEGTYTCYIRGIHNYTGLVECTYTVGESAVTYTSASISLAGDIGVNYYAQLSDDIVADEGAYMQFTVAGQTQTVPLRDAVVSTNADGITTYRFTCKVASKQMTENITGQMYLSDGTAIGEAKVYSVKAYCDAAIPVYSQYAAYANLVDLMEAMLNYGGYSQTQFGYNTANLANAGMDTTLPTLTAADVDAYAHGAVGEEAGISVASVSLLLESTTTIRFYFNLDGSKSIDEYTFYVDGVETTPVESNGQYYVDKVNVAAKDLDEMVTVTVGGLTARYCGLSYVRQVVVLYPDYYSAALVNVAKALYAYNQAANAYFA